VRAHRETPLETARRIGRLYRMPILLVLTYMVMRGLVAILGTENLLLVWAAALGAALALVQVLTRSLPTARSHRRSRGPS